MAWAFVGVSTVVETTTTTLSLTMAAGVADGDLLVACIALRTTSTTSISNTGWTLVSEQKTNNTLTTSSAVASGCMFYQIRAGASDVSFTLPAGISVAMGRIIAYRNVDQSSPKDTQTSFTTATNTTAVSGVGLTTTQSDDLIVAMCAGGQEAAWSVFNNVTTPLTASGATDTTTAPSTTAWIERADTITTTGADTSLAIFDAVRTAAGATGNLTATASLGAGHVVIAGAFKILLPPPADAWNSADKSASIALSNSDKTATLSSAVQGAVRSSTTRANETAGKYYAEFLVVNQPTTVSFRVGIQNNSTALITTASGSFNIRHDAVVFINSTSSSLDLGANLVTGDVVCVAWDAGAERVWFRVNNGLWNNSGSADPATGTGGSDASSAAAGNHSLWFYGSDAAQAVTIRTETAEFTQTGPSGFTSWMGEALGAPATKSLAFRSRPNRNFRQTF